jgi:DNA repair photolyase
MEELLGVSVPSPRETFRIRETTVRQALRADPLPWLDYSFNPYVGCYHGCLFCYVPRLLQIDRAEWGASVVVKRNAATVLAREVRKLPKGLVAISTATDPYQFVEGRYRITRHALEVLLRAQWPVSVLSRSPLMLRDIDLFQQFDEIEVGMSVPTLDDQARALLEPWAPPIEARLRCLTALAGAGLATFVSFAPAYPPTNGSTPSQIAEAFAVAGVRRMFARTLDERWGVREAMRERLAPSPLEAPLSRISDQRFMEQFVEEVATTCESKGIQFGHPRRRRGAGGENREPGAPRAFPPQGRRTDRGPKFIGTTFK